MSLLHLHHKLPAGLEIRHAAVLRPFQWLLKGWQDFVHQPQPSLAHGLIVTGLFLVVLLVTSHHIYMIAAAISGFMLIGPILASGLCELSRRRETNEPVSFDDSLSALSRHSKALTQFASTLLGFSVLWFFLSGLVLLVTVGTIAPDIDKSLWGGSFEMVNTMQWLLYLVVGGILAVAVFVLSVVAVPAIIDNDVSALDAMLLSLRVSAENSLTLLIWAGLIVALMAVALMTYLLAMIIIYPLLGHATWHAYRDLIKHKT